MGGEAYGLPAPRPKVLRVLRAERGRLAGLARGREVLGPLVDVGVLLHRLVRVEAARLRARLLRRRAARLLRALGRVRPGRRRGVREVEQVVDLLDLGDLARLRLERVDEIGGLDLAAQVDLAVDDVDVDLVLRPVLAAEDLRLDLAGDRDVGQVLGLGRALRVRTLTLRRLATLLLLALLALGRGLLLGPGAGAAAGQLSGRLEGELRGGGRHVEDPVDHGVVPPWSLPRS